MPHTDERLASIESILERMERRLFGNGQPGELDKLDSRLSRLEQFRWAILGAAALISGGAVWAIELFKK